MEYPNIRKYILPCLYSKVCLNDILNFSNCILSRNIRPARKFKILRGGGATQKHIVCILVNFYPIFKISFSLCKLLTGQIIGGGKLSHLPPHSGGHVHGSNFEYSHYLPRYESVQVLTYWGCPSDQLLNTENGTSLSIIIKSLKLNHNWWKSVISFQKKYYCQLWKVFVLFLEVLSEPYLKIQLFRDKKFKVWNKW